MDSLKQQKEYDPDFVSFLYIPKVGIKLLLISHLLPESFVSTRARLLLLASFLFVALVNPFNPYSPLNSYFFAILVYVCVHLSKYVCVHACINIYESK